MKFKKGARVCVMPYEKLIDFVRATPINGQIVGYWIPGDSVRGWRGTIVNGRGKTAVVLLDDIGDVLFSTIEDRTVRIEKNCLREPNVLILLAEAAQSPRGEICVDRFFASGNHRRDCGGG